MLVFIYFIFINCLMYCCYVAAVEPSLIILLVFL